MPGYLPNYQIVSSVKWGQVIFSLHKNTNVRGLCRFIVIPALIQLRMFKMEKTVILAPSPLEKAIEK